MQGGVAFDTVGSDTTPVAANHLFQLYDFETAARQNLVEGEPGNNLVLDVDFDQSVRGLSPGAQVQFQGIPVGEVTGVQGVSDTVDGRVVLRQRATITIVPERFGQPPAPEGSEARTVALDYIEARVKDGLRAQLAEQGLLTQTLYVNLVELPAASPATFDRDAKPHPLLPSAPSQIGAVADSAAGFMDRISSLPIEEVVQNAVALLGNLNAIVSDPKVKSAPENLGALVADLKSTLDESGIREAPAQIADILSAVKVVVDQANQAQLVQNLSDMLATTKTAVASIGTAADGVPEVLSQVDALSAQVQKLPLDQLVASANRVIDGLDAFVRSDQMTALPASVAASLTDLRGVVSELRAGGAVTNLNASLASVRQISDQLAAAKLAESLARVLAEAEKTVNAAGTAAGNLPTLIDSLAGLTENARALPLDDLVARADDLLATANGVLASEGVRNAPAQLRAVAGGASGAARPAQERRRRRQPQRHARLGAAARRPACARAHCRGRAGGGRRGQGRGAERLCRHRRPAAAHRINSGGRGPGEGAAPRPARRLAQFHPCLCRRAPAQRGRHQPAAKARRRSRRSARNPRRGAHRRHRRQGELDARLRRPRRRRARRQPARARRPLYRGCRPGRRRAGHGDAGFGDQPSDDPGAAGAARRRALRQPARDDLAASSQLHHLREMTMAARPRPLLAAGLALAALMALGACASETAYLLPPAPATQRLPSPVRGIALADVNLPAYVSNVEIAGLVGPETVKLHESELWADDPTRAVTRHLAAALEARLATHVITDPWPGYKSPGLRVEVAVDRLIGAPAGAVEFAGQYVMLDPESGRITATDRFAITIPPQGEGFPGMMAGEARAIEALADRIAARISGRRLS